MARTDLEACITDFLAMGRRLQTAQPVTGERVLDALVAWYIDSRVAGAEVLAMDDMLLLPWGKTRLYDLSGPADFRKPRECAVVRAPGPSRYLDFTRQVFASGEDPEADFDASALQMSITLGFEPADGTESCSHAWIQSPQDVPEGLRTFREVPFVRAHLAIPAHRITVIVDHCG